jgi:hypothetical protein
MAVIEQIHGILFPYDASREHALPDDLIEHFTGKPNPLLE